MAVAKGKRRLRAARPVTAAVRRRARLSWLEALGLVASVSAVCIVTGAVLVIRTDPERFPDLGTALWWAAATVTTVGYGDVVPASAGGRLVGVVLMFVGIGSFALLTAVAASAIVVSEVGEEELRIEAEERDIQRTLGILLARIDALDARLDRLDRRQQAYPGRTASPRSRYRRARHG